jgi:trimeric autotransporter adhesin
MRKFGSDLACAPTNKTHKNSKSKIKPKDKKMKNHPKQNPIKPMNILIAAVTLAWLGVAPLAKAVVPEPDGGYPGGNTAEGQNALLSLTSGTYNTAVGVFSLMSNAEGKFSTGIGAGALLTNTADQNTATGAGALLNNTTGAINTANGAFALFSNTIGTENTAIGFYALFSNTEGFSNTAIGGSALATNTTGHYNTASGVGALGGNTEGSRNTAAGYSALQFNQAGNNNTANGSEALQVNTGSFNTAAGSGALLHNTSGGSNTATGFQALFGNTEGGLNTANGFKALYSNSSGGSNTADGDLALYNNTTGTSNVALGSSAGFNATTGNGNVYIGQGMVGVAEESNHTYIRNVNTTSVSGGSADFVTVDLNTGLFGHASSSRRYKEDIKPMDDTSEALFALKPVTFRYKKEIDKSQSLQYGLVAEDVAQVDPDLAIRDGKGQIENVRYSAVNAMLLNEFLKEHKKVEEQQATIAKLESTVAQQQKDFVATTAQQHKQIEALTARVNEQAAQIQRVSAQMELNTFAGRTAGRIRRGGPATQQVALKTP